MFLFICIFILTKNPEIEALTEMWTKVSLETKYIPIDTMTLNFKSGKTKCGSSCIANHWCKTWCFKHENCSLSSISVSPYYVAHSTDSVPCFTKKRTDLAFGVKTYSSQLYAPHRLSSYSNDGVYYNDKVKFATRYDNYPWVLYDLGKLAIVFEIRIQTYRSIKYGPLYTTNIEIKIGNSLAINGDFSKYEIFDSMIGNCKYEEINYFKPLIPMEGRYVVIISQGYNVLLAFDYIEIDGKFKI